MIYEVWFKQDQDGRAPEYAFLENDYKWSGELEARSLKDLAGKMQLLDAEESGLTDHRALSVGDVVREGNGAYWILTPVGLWAQVTAFEGAGPDA